jgi:hypothetical protein
MLGLTKPSKMQLPKPSKSSSYRMIAESIKFGWYLRPTPRSLDF